LIFKRLRSFERHRARVAPTNPAIIWRRRFPQPEGPSSEMNSLLDRER
jgi:hypothetical protein